MLKDCNLIAPPYPKTDAEVQSPVWAQYDEVKEIDHGSTHSYRVLRGYPFTNEHLPTIFFSCGKCAGGATFECQNGHAGRLCSSCAGEPEKWSSILGVCKKCNNDWRDYFVGIGGTSGVVLVWVWLNALSAGDYDALDIALQFTQVPPLGQPSSFSPNH